MAMAMDLPMKNWPRIFTNDGRVKLKRLPRIIIDRWTFGRVKLVLSAPAYQAVLTFRSLFHNNKFVSH